MGCLTEVWENYCLGHTFGGDPITQPTSIWLGIGTDVFVTGDGEGTIQIAANEVPFTNGYGRLEIPVGTTNWDLSSSARAVSNVLQLQFPAASGGAWGDISHYGLFITETGQTEADLIAYGTFSNMQTVSDTEAPYIRAGELSVTAQPSYISNYLARALLDHIFGGAANAFTQPATWTVGLSSQNPGPDGTGISEPSSSNGYDRVTHTTWRTPGNGVLDNQNAIVFPTASSEWPTMNYGMIFTGSNLLFYGALDSAVTVASGETARFDDGALDLGID